MANENIDLINAVLDFASDRFETPTQKKEDVRWNKQFLATLSRADTMAAADERKTNLMYFGNEEGTGQTLEKQRLDKTIDPKKLYHLTTEQDVARYPGLTVGQYIDPIPWAAMVKADKNMMVLGEEMSIYFYNDKTHAANRINPNTYLSMRGLMQSLEPINKNLLMPHLSDKQEEELDKKVLTGPNAGKTGWETITPGSVNETVLMALIESNTNITMGLKQIRAEEWLKADLELANYTQVNVTHYETDAAWYDPLNEEDRLATIRGDHDDILNNPGLFTLRTISENISAYKALHETDIDGVRVGHMKSDAALKQLRHYIMELVTREEYWNMPGSIYTNEFREAEAVLSQAQVAYKTITGKFYKPPQGTMVQPFPAQKYGWKTKTAPTGGGGGASVSIASWPSTSANPKYRGFFMTDKYNRAVKKVNGGDPRSISEILTAESGFSKAQADWIVSHKSK